MEGYNQFNQQFEALLRAYQASSGGDYARACAKMVGALSIIIPFNTDDKNLRALAQRMELSEKSETLEILKAEA